MRRNSEMGGILSMCRSSEMGGLLLVSKKSPKQRNGLSFAFEKEIAATQEWVVLRW